MLLAGEVNRNRQLGEILTVVLCLLSGALTLIPTRGLPQHEEHCSSHLWSESWLEASALQWAGPAVLWASSPQPGAGSHFLECLHLPLPVGEFLSIQRTSFELYSLVFILYLFVWSAAKSSKEKCAFVPQSQKATRPTMCSVGRKLPFPVLTRSQTLHSSARGPSRLGHRWGLGVFV